MIFAVGSYVLPLLGMQFIILFWMYTWGPGVALMIQGGMLVLGIVLIVASVMRGSGVPRPSPYMGPSGPPGQGPPATGA